MRDVKWRILLVSCSSIQQEFDLAVHERNNMTEPSSIGLRGKIEAVDKKISDREEALKRHRGSMALAFPPGERERAAIAIQVIESEMEGLRFERQHLQGQLDATRARELERAKVESAVEANRIATTTATATEKLAETATTTATATLRLAETANTIAEEAKKGSRVAERQSWIAIGVSLLSLAVAGIGAYFAALPRDHQLAKNETIRMPVLAPAAAAVSPIDGGTLAEDGGAHSDGGSSQGARKSSRRDPGGRGIPSSRSGRGPCGPEVV